MNERNVIDETTIHMYECHAISPEEQTSTNTDSEFNGIQLILIEEHIMI